MSDDEIDARLRDHGVAWRAANQDRPGVDWDTVTVTRRWRGWLAVAAVAAAAAAIIVPLALTSAGHPLRKPAPLTHPHRTLTHPHPTTNPVALAGAPKDFVALHDGAVTFVWAHRIEKVHSTNHHATALGVSADGKVAYAAYPLSGCRIRIEKTVYSQSGGRPQLSTTTVMTIAGGQPAANSVPQRTAMAVSPDGMKLALAVTTHRGDPGPAGCQGSEQLVVINLRSLAVRRWRSSPSNGELASLHWAPDNHRLAFWALYWPPPSPKLQVLDTSASGTDGDYALATIVVKYPQSSVVFWWHGELVTIVKGGLMRISASGALHQVTGNFPQQVDSVSSDPTGDHLLLSSGGATYRWDNGYLSVVKGHWTQPGW